MFRLMEDELTHKVSCIFLIIQFPLPHPNTVTICIKYKRIYVAITCQIKSYHFLRTWYSYTTKQGVCFICRKTSHLTQTTKTRSNTGDLAKATETRLVYTHILRNNTRNMTQTAQTRGNSNHLSEATETRLVYIHTGAIRLD